MRRVASIAVVLLALAALVGLLVFRAVSSSSNPTSTSRVDAIFDDARGLIKRQVVKVAGAKVGQVVDVVVTPDYKARVEAQIQSQFMPFRTNATCTIRPEGLIAENYLECDPGSPPAPVLKGHGGSPPTVPVANTTEPVSLLDLFNIFNLPTRQRFQVLVNELGIGTAARGQDINDIIRRANPALGLARQAIGILSRQRSQLATIVDATNQIAADAAGHTSEVQSFLSRAAALTTLTAAHRGNLALAIQRLPGLLAVAQPALQQLDTVAVGGTPLVQQIHAAVPALNRVATDLGPLVSVARPGLARLRGALKQGIPAIKAVTPVVREVRAYSTRSLPQTKLTGRLFTSLQQAGFLENFLGIVYYVGSIVSRFDSISHVLDITLPTVNNGACIQYATTPVPGCQANFGSPPAPSAGDRASARARRATASDAGAVARNRSAARSRPAPVPGRPAGTRQPAALSPAAASPPAGGTSTGATPPGSVLQSTVQSLQSLTSYLLR